MIPGRGWNKDVLCTVCYLRLLEERYPERETPGSYVMPWINLGELDSARKYIEKNTLDLELSHSDDIASHALNYAYQFILGVKENKPVEFPYISVTEGTV